MSDFKNGDTVSLIIGDKQPLTIIQIDLPGFPEKMVVKTRLQILYVTNKALHKLLPEPAEKTLERVREAIEIHRRESYNDCALTNALDKILK